MPLHPDDIADATAAEGPKARGRGRWTREVYDLLVVGFRQQPGNMSHAARVAGTSNRTAKRAWEKGWGAHSWAQPIKLLMAQEAARTRAARAESAHRAALSAEAEREKRRAEERDAQGEERQVLKAARKDVLAVLILCAELVPTMRELAKAVSEACKPGPNGIPAIAPKDAMSLLAKHATLMAKGVSAAETIVTLSRLDRGVHTEAIGVMPILAEDLTYEQALEELAMAEGILAEARARGALTVPALPPSSNGAGR